MKNTLELKQVSKSFGGVRAVNNLSIAFAQGKITALVGPNGAGKTTAFNLVSGLLQPDEGTVTFEGKPISGKKPWEIASLGIGRLFQDVRLFKKMTVLENVMSAFKQQNCESVWRVLFAPWTEWQPEKSRRERAMALLEKVDLLEKADSLAETLSYGQQKLVAIARLLAADAKLLLLDEPTAGVNPKMIESLMKVVRTLVAEGKTVVFVEHNLSVVEKLADWIEFMESGTAIRQGSHKEVFSDPHVRASYVGNHKSIPKPVSVF